ncbi:hypothetical protein CJ030_MR8G027686 [Morella rubra]|uniref:Uncharacterized protein n=1 Tax=Morella rubra TaxID=262757 RepID=A0A6A1UTV9_9ROSI|nr:hypothetical protein CJ030_MR8G027686 [Morella rubra]
MDDSTELNPEPPPPSSSALRRRNSIAASVVVPRKLSLPTRIATKPLHSFHSLPHQNGTASPLDTELVSSLKSSLDYTSLKDLLPSSSGAAMGSPTATNSGYEISIRNRLVKQAAWAYLQPMSSSPSSSCQNFLPRLRLRFFSSLTACLAFFKSHLLPAMRRLIDWILRACQLQMNI